MFFDDWSQIGRAALLAALVYAALLALIRAAGSRAVSKMSAHDPIVTVTLEQALAVVLEIDGSWSVIPRSEMRKRSALEGLELPDSNAH